MAEAKKKTEAARPLILEIDEAKNEITTAINDAIRKHKLPAYFMEPVVANIYNQIAAAAQQELSKVK